MLLMQSVQDETMAVAGFEHHTFMCSSCHDVERRLVFARQDEQASEPSEPSEVAQTGAVADPSVEDVLAYTELPLDSGSVERAPAPGILRRALARWRGD
jgi:hypothetical protein